MAYTVSDTFALKIPAKTAPEETDSEQIDASLTVKDGYKSQEVAPGAAFAVYADYTLGFPRAYLPFSITWALNKGTGNQIIGSDAPSGYIVPNVPRLTRTAADGKIVQIGSSAQQIVAFKGRMPTNAETGWVYSATFYINQSGTKSFHDTFQIKVPISGQGRQNGSVSVPVQYASFSTNEQRGFGMLFHYTIGHPAATAPFALNWGALPVDQQPSIIITPSAPASTKSIAGSGRYEETAPVGPTETQIGSIRGTFPNNTPAGTYTCNILMYQP